MKFYVICRRVGDVSFASWGPGWGRIGGHLTDYGEANDKCRQYLRIYSGTCYQFSVVVGEYDPELASSEHVELLKRLHREALCEYFVGMFRRVFPREVAVRLFNLTSSN